MDIPTLPAMIKDFRFTDSDRASHGYTRILIQLFGFLGHGKSSFINTCKFVLDGGDYNNLAEADSSNAGRTTRRVSYPLTKDIILVDNRGCATMNSYETGEIFAQLANLLPLDQEVEWSRGFRLVDKIVDAETEILKSDFIFPVFLYSIKMGIKGQEFEELKSLLETARDLTGVFPYVVLTHKTHGRMSAVKSAFRDMGVERIFALENYTPEDHDICRARHEDVQRFFQEIIREVQFKVKQARDPVQEFKNRKQFVLKFIFEQEMRSQRSELDQKEKAEQVFLSKRLESLRLKSETQRSEDRRHFEEQMRMLQEEFEYQRKKDDLKFQENMREYQERLKKKKDCKLQ